MEIKHPRKYQVNQWENKVDLQILTDGGFQEQLCDDMWGSPEPKVDEHFMTLGFQANWVWISCCCLSTKSCLIHCNHAKVMWCSKLKEIQINENLKENMRQMENALKYNNTKGNKGGKKFF